MRKYLFFFVFSILLFSCSKKEIPPVFEEPINIRMRENIDSTNRSLTFNCYTDKIFECSNYYLENTVKVSDGKITINFIKVVSPNICLTSTGPANAVIELGGLASKIYDLEIIAGSQKLSGQLNVSSSNFSAVLPAQNKVKFTNPELNRIPANTIYGTVHYFSTALLPAVDKFTDSLQLLGATPGTYISGNYDEFIIEPSGQIKQTQDLGYYFTRYFIYNYAGASAPVRQLVKNFGRTYSDSLSITVKNSKGETFYSWGN